MTSFSRKIKRKQLADARKKFTKDFKTAMANFKRQVKCSVCGQPPSEGQNIDNWRINKNSENIDLVCTNCYDSGVTQGDEDETETNTEL